MSMTDPIADMLTRIRNGFRANKMSVLMPYSKFKHEICKVLKQEGYIRECSKVANDNGFDDLKVELKYVDGESVINTIERVSRPGQRSYSASSKIKRYYNGLGTVILSTPKGVITDSEAVKEGVGGEIVCQVF